MTQTEFIEQLRTALENDLSNNLVNENVDYYRQYIRDEVQTGKREEEVLSMLGDPWILARTIIDTAGGQGHSAVYDGGQTAYEGYKSDSVKNENKTSVRVMGFDKWWKKVLLIVAVIMVIVLVFSIVTGIVSILAPFIIPVLVIMFVVRVLGNRRR